MTELARPKSTGSSPLKAQSGGAQQAERTYVLDTSVLLSDPKAVFRFAEHHVVLPVVVITELEAKRNDPEIGYFARQALRNLDELRVQHERLDFPIAVGDGGSLRVELNHSNMSVLPSGSAARRQRLAHPRGRAQPRQRRAGCLRRLEGPAAAGEGRIGRPRRRGVQGRARGRLRLDRHGRDRPRLRPDGEAVRRRDPLDPAGRRHADQHRARHPLGSRFGPRPGHRRAASCGSCAATATSSDCTAAAPSSVSRSTCCSTRRSASCRSAAARAPASRRSRCARVSRPCSRSSSTARSWCSVRSTPSVARSSASCRGMPRRR